MGTPVNHGSLLLQVSSLSETPVTKQLHQTDPASAVIVCVGRGVPDASYSAVAQMTGSPQTGSPEWLLVYK